MECHRKRRGPTGGLQGSGLLCTAPGVAQQLKLSGTIYGGWRSTEGSLMEFRLLERIILPNTGKQGGFFDLYGRWRGQQLVMDERGRWGGPFRAGLKIDGAAVTLDWSGTSEFNAMCASGPPKPTPNCCR